MTEHELRYRAGSIGLGRLGLSDVAHPHWYCTCGEWWINRKPNGSPHRETAEKHWRRHADCQGSDIRSTSSLPRPPTCESKE